MSKILLIDDEPAITESLAYALVRDGFEAFAVGDLAEADRALLRDSFDLIVLDLGLPDGYGLDWLKTLRQTSSLPVIILSSHDDAAEHIAGLDCGADDYVDKPFSLREMVARVRAVLRRTGETQDAADVAALRRSSEQDAADASALRLDGASRQAFVGHQLLHLSRTEFDLLAAFLAHSGRVLDRESLLSLVWGPDVAVTERTIDVHVKSLRKKLSAAGLSGEVIETVRGVGYRCMQNSMM